MQLSHATSDFLSALDTQRAASAHTITAYRIALEQFQRYLMEAWGSEPAVEDLTEADIRPFLGWLHDEGLAKRSLRMKLAAVKSPATDTRLAAVPQPDETIKRGLSLAHPLGLWLYPIQCRARRLAVVPGVSGPSALFVSVE
jgi:hypothetical protein